MIVPVILSGGSGTRLWPLSRARLPKQFLALVSDRTLFQDTVARLDSVSATHSPAVVVCNEVHSAIVAEQLEAIGREPVRIVLEPEGRNTAPAAAVAALLAQSLFPDDDPALLLLPADHNINDQDSFARAVAVAAEEAARDKLVTFGVRATRAETGYGYVKRGGSRGGAFEVERFVEKPTVERAQDYVDSGDYFWNSGMFMFSARLYLDELANSAPQILSASREALEKATHRGSEVSLARDAFLACEADSIDYAVMERTSRAVVVPLDAGWSDVGSWDSLYDACATNEDDNALVGDVLALGCRRSYIRASDRLIVGIGLDDVVIVDTPDALLVLPRNASQEVKEITARLKADGRHDLLEAVAKEKSTS